MGLGNQNEVSLVAGNGSTAKAYSQATWIRAETGHYTMNVARSTNVIKVAFGRKVTDGGKAKIQRRREHMRIRISEPWMMSLMTF